MSTRDFSGIADQLHNNRQELIARLLQTLAANDFASLPQYMAENVQLTISGFPAIDGSWCGREAVVATMTANFGKITEQKSQLRGMIQQGDLLALRVYESGRLSGVPYEVDAVFWMVFDGDVLTEITEFVHCL